MKNRQVFSKGKVRRTIWLNIWCLRSGNMFVFMATSDKTTERNSPWELSEMGKRVKKLNKMKQKQSSSKSWCETVAHAAIRAARIPAAGKVRGRTGTGWPACLRPSQPALQQWLLAAAPLTSSRLPLPSAALTREQTHGSLFNHTAPPFFALHTLFIPAPAGRKGQRLRAQ